MLDNEFVAKRGRTISVARRYPEAFSISNLLHIHLAMVGETIVSIAVAKPFSYAVADRVLHAAMIGFVWTRVEWRGRGLATNVLRNLVGLLAEEDLGFAVLWSTQPSFYDRLGWVVKDTSLYGRARGSRETALGINRLDTMPAAVTWDRIERLRERAFGERVIRSQESYTGLPLPAKEVTAIFAQDHDEEGFALVGYEGGNAYLYEWSGSPAILQDLWDELRRTCSTFFVNERADSPSGRWLTENTGIDLRRQELAMWLQLSRTTPSVDLPDHIPYFDRL